MSGQSHFCVAVAPCRNTYSVPSNISRIVEFMETQVKRENQAFLLWYNIHKVSFRLEGNVYLKDALTYTTIKCQDFPAESLKQ